MLQAALKKKMWVPVGFASTWQLVCRCEHTVNYEPKGMLILSHVETLT